MKSRFFVFFLIILIGVSGGCSFLHNPLKAFTKSQANITKVETKIQDNKDQLVDQAKQYVYSANLSLAQNPQTNQYTALAEDFDSKALLTLGPPTVEEVQQLTTMVNNLLSTNKQLVIKGEQALADMNDKVESLQAENENLQQKLTKAQEKATKVGEENAVMANKWNNLMRWIHGVIYGVGGLIALSLVGTCLPPPYNLIGTVASMPLGILTRLIHGVSPGTQAIAGVCPASYQTATSDLVNVIDQLKSQNPTMHPQISALVASTVSDSAVNAINSAKASQGIVS